MPPPVDTCQRPPEVGKGCTYTSSTPDSLLTYATQRPSGENTPFCSSNGPCRYGRGFSALVVLPSPWGTTHKSCPVFAPGIWYIRNRPSLDQSVAQPVGVPSFMSIVSWPSPVEDLMNRLYTPPFRFEGQTTRSPSGDQIGRLSCAASNDSLERIPRVRSRTQMSWFPDST